MVVIQGEAIWLQNLTYPGKVVIEYGFPAIFLLKYYLFVTISLLLLLLKKRLQSYTATPARMNWCVAACPSPKIKLDGTKKNWYVSNDCPCITF